MEQDTYEEDNEISNKKKENKVSSFFGRITKVADYILNPTSQYSEHKNKKSPSELPLFTSKEEDEMIKKNDEFLREYEQRNSLPNVFKLKAESMGYPLPTEAYAAIQEDSIVIIRTNGFGVTEDYDRVYTRKDSGLYKFCNMILEMVDKNVAGNIIQKGVPSNLIFYLSEGEPELYNDDFDDRDAESDTEFNFGFGLFNDNSMYRRENESGVAYGDGSFYDTYINDEERPESLEMKEISSDSNNIISFEEKKIEDSTPLVELKEDDEIVLTDKVHSRKNKHQKNEWLEEDKNTISESDDNKIETRNENLIDIPLSPNDIGKRLFTFKCHEEYYEVSYDIWRLYLLNLTLQKSNSILYLAFEKRKNELLTDEGKAIFESITKENNFAAVPSLINRAIDSLTLIEKITENTQSQTLSDCILNLSNALTQIQNIMDKLSVVSK